MRYNPDLHHRHSIRLRGYNYSQQGAYFVTVCVHNRECLLGEIIGGTVVLTDVGLAVERTWEDLLERFAFLRLDAYILMPNHLHAILIITDPAQVINAVDVEGACRGSACRTLGAASGAPTDAMGTQTGTVMKAALGKVLRTFKSVSAIQANRLLDRAQQPFWQRNYYERIVRDDQEMEQIRAYIEQNPLRWATDTENPDANTTP